MFLSCQSRSVLLVTTCVLCLLGSFCLEITAGQLLREVLDDRYKDTIRSCTSLQDSNTREATSLPRVLITAKMDMEKKIVTETPLSESDEGVGEVINASGHKQELQRQFSLLSICSVGITTGNVWAALGGSIVSLLAMLILILTFNQAEPRVSC